MVRQKEIRTTKISGVNGKISIVKVTKSKSVQVNDKWFYLSDDIVSLPISHPLLKYLIDYKEGQGKKIEEFILKKNPFKIRTRRRDKN